MPTLWSSLRRQMDLWQMSYHRFGGEWQMIAIDRWLMKKIQGGIGEYSFA